MSVSVNRDGSTEAWDGNNYVALGSMRTDAPAPSRETVMVFPPPTHVYGVVEERPAFTIDEFSKTAKYGRQQERRKRKLRALLRLATELAAGVKPGEES